MSSSRRHARTNWREISHALDELPRSTPPLAEVVDLKFFCGFSFAEIAAMKGISERTVQRQLAEGAASICIAPSAAPHRSIEKESIGCRPCDSPDRRPGTVISPYLDQALELSDDERRGLAGGAARQLIRTLAAHLESWLAQLRHDERGRLPRRCRGCRRRRARRSPACTIGAYRLVAPIGQGGMGSVWLAERSDGRFEGRVAVKLLNVGAASDAPARSASRAKARILARLHASAHRPSHRRRRLAGRAAVPRAGARRRRARSIATATQQALDVERASACSSTCWRRSRTRTPTSSCIAT